MLAQDSTGLLDQQPKYKGIIALNLRNFHREPHRRPDPVWVLLVAPRCDALLPDMAKRGVSNSQGGPPAAVLKRPRRSARIASSAPSDALTSVVGQSRAERRSMASESTMSAIRDSSGSPTTSYLGSSPSQSQVIDAPVEESTTIPSSGFPRRDSREYRKPFDFPDDNPLQCHTNSACGQPSVVIPWREPSPEEYSRIYTNSSSPSPLFIAPSSHSLCYDAQNLDRAVNHHSPDCVSHRHPQELSLDDLKQGRPTTGPGRPCNSKKGEGASHSGRGPAPQQPEAVTLGTPRTRTPKQFNTGRRKREGRSCAVTPSVIGPITADAISSELLPHQPGEIPCQSIASLFTSKDFRLRPDGAGEHHLLRTLNNERVCSRSAAIGIRFD